MAEKNDNPRNVSGEILPAVIKMGRRPFQVDWKLVDKLCQIHCPANEIAAHIGCHINTLLDNCKRDHGMTFRDYWKRHASHSNIALRTMIFKEVFENHDKFWTAKIARQWLKMDDNAPPVDEEIDIKEAEKHEEESTGATIQIMVKTKEGVEKYTPGQFYDKKTEKSE